MCVPNCSQLCLVCLLLYGSIGCQAKADTPKYEINTTDKYAASSVNVDVTKDTEEFYFMEKDFFMTKLMTKYGNGIEMSYEGFEHLLHNLGLGSVFRFDHKVSGHRSDNSSEFLQLHPHHNHSTDEENNHIHNDEDNHDHDHTDEHNHDHDHSDEHNHDHDHTDEHNHDHDHTDEDSLEHEHSGEHKNHDHTDEHNHDHSGEHSHDHEHSGEHNHDHTDEHNHDHTDDHNHDHTDDHNHDHTDDHNHDHDHTDEHNHDHTDDHEHDHTDEHNHDHTDEHNHDHTDDHNHDHTDDHNHDHTDDHNHDHDHTDEHNHDHTDDHEHDHTDEHNHDHTDEHNHDHDHTDEHNHDHTDEHNHDHDHTDEHNHDHDHTDEHNHDHTNEHNHDHDHTDEHNHDHDHDIHKREVETAQCLSASMMLRLVSRVKPKSITRDMFVELCPSLVYQIEEGSCENSRDEKLDDLSTRAKSDSVDISNVSLKVWGYSSLSVIVISLVGLAGVAVIPFMQKVFYNHMLQFLVALAVGTLSGDALLHLFPHAIAGHDHSGKGGHSHDTGPIYKGLCGLLGIYFFFFTERVLTIFTDYKRKKKLNRMNKKKGVNDEEMMTVGEKLANNVCDGRMMSIHPNKALGAYADETHNEHCKISYENSTSISHDHVHRKMCEVETCSDGDEYSSMVSDSCSTSSRQRRHVHSHDIDGLSNSVASVAWMLIMGDGIHNFCDGLAIGAAFASSITGGFSTSVAIFCHELPHEIGDFAVLLRAGMTPKQAIVYSSLSSILCFVGMVVGVAVGNLEGATLWIFTIVGGMFVYIALVDMLPELSAVDTKKGEHPLCHLLLQGIGMLSGAGIMLAIALYEGDLMTILD